MIIVQAAKTNDLPITNKLATTENQPVVFFSPSYTPCDPTIQYHFTISQEI